MANDTVKEQDILNQQTSITVLKNYDNTAPTKVFQGYDSISGKGLSTATMGTTITTKSENSTNISVCTDMVALAQALHINQSLLTGFGAITSFDKKTQLLQDLNITTYSTSIVIYTSHIINIETATNVRLTHGIIPPTNKTERNAFFQAYGDAYLSSVTQGGEYYAVYIFYTQTAEEQTSLTTEMKAHGIYDGITVDTNLQINLTKFIDSTPTRYIFKQNVSGLLNPQLPNPSHLISFALSFSSTILTSPTVIDFKTIGYENVHKIEDFEPIRSNRYYFVGDSAVDGLTERLIQIKQLLNQINWLQNTYNFYGGYTDTKVQQVKAQASADLTEINRQIQQYEFDPTQSFTMPALPSLTYGSPVLRYQVNDSPAYGANGGRSFNDTNVTTAIQQHQRITSIQLHTSSYINNLTTTYQNDKRTFKRSHGSDSGTLGPLLTLLPGQFITGISGRSSQHINSLQIQISDGRTVSGGDSNGSSYSWKVPAGCFIVGFSGRSGNYLDQIQINYAGFQPANWQ